MTFNHELFNVDIDKFQYSKSWSERQMNEAIGITRSTRWRISMGKPISMETFCKCLRVLKLNTERYFNNNLNEST